MRIHTVLQLLPAQRTCGLEGELLVHDLVRMRAPVQGRLLCSVRPLLCLRQPEREGLG